MGVERLQTHPVVDDDAVAEDSQIVGEDHSPLVGRAYWRVRCGGEVEAQVYLLVNLVTLVDIRTVVCEARFDLRVGQLSEGTVPQYTRRGVIRERRDRRSIPKAQLSVDEQIKIEPFRVRTVRVLVGEVRCTLHDRWDDPPQEVVADLDTRP